MERNQDIAAINNIVKSQVRKQDLVAGARMTYFKFLRPVNSSDSCSGKLVVIGEREEDSRFFIYSVESIDQVNAIVEVSSKLRTPFLLSIKLASETFPPNGPSEELVLCYEHFDDIFNNWITKNPKEPFIAAEELLNKWWRTQIRNILDTLEYMHGKRIFHGNMKKDSSYVVVKDSIHLINASIDGSGKNEEELKELARNDLQGLKELVMRYVLPKFSSADWVEFTNLFEIATVRHLRKHPVLLDALERFKYFRAISGFLSVEMPLPMSRMFHTSLLAEDPLKFSGWNTKFPVGSVLHDVYSHNNASYPLQPSLALLVYVTKLFDRYNKFSTKRSIPPCSREQVERIASTTYPGFLSYFHRVLVKRLPNSSFFAE